MRGTVTVEVVVATTLLGVVAAQETTSLFLPYFSPGHPLLVSIIDADHTATTYSVACSIYEPSIPNGCRVPIPFYLTSGPTFMHATMSLPSISEIRTHTTTQRSIPLLHEYLYHFPAYTEDAYCHLHPASASCLVTATGGALTVPVFTNRRTLAGEGFWGGWREAVVTDVMPRSYAGVGGEGGGGEGGNGNEKGEGEERVWRKSVVSDIPQTQDAEENSATVKRPAKTLGAVVPKETGRGADGGAGWAMMTTAMPGADTGASVEEDADVVLDGADAVGNHEDALITTKIEAQEVTETKLITETAVVTETIVVTELAVIDDTDVQGDERTGVVKEDL